MKLILTASLAAAAAVPALAQIDAPAEMPAERVTRVTVFGNEPCPRGETGEIVICGRLDESERYRIPEELRETGEEDPEGTAWAARAKSLEFVGRSGIQSCSTVGPGGFTGCWAEMMRAARGDRGVDGEAGK